MKFKIGLISLFAIIGTVWGHGNMVYPPVWQDAGGEIGLSSYGHMFIGKASDQPSITQLHYPSSLI